MRKMISTVSIIQAELFLKKTKQNLNSRKKKETKCCRICHEWMPRRSAPRATSLHRYREGKKTASHWAASTDKLSPLKATHFSSWTYNNTTTIAINCKLTITLKTPFLKSRMVESLSYWSMPPCRAMQG